MTLLFAVITVLIRNTEAIWLQTRILGLISFAFLFTTVIIGELRILKGGLKIFRYHKPIGIFTVYLVGLHFLAAILDNFQWGKYAPAYQYLGFSFGSKWLVFLSLGALAFYLLVLIGATSASKNMRRLGFKRWKIIHYSSYVSFIFAYIHGVNLGTDIKSGVLSPILTPVFVGAFVLVTGMLLVRLLKGVELIKTPFESFVATAVVLVMIITVIFTATSLMHTLEQVQEMKVQRETIDLGIDTYQEHVSQLDAQNQLLEKQLEVIRGNQN